LLTIPERFVFTFMLTVLGAVTAAGFYGIFNIVRSGRAAPPLKNVPRRMFSALIDVGLQKTIFRARPVLSVLHTFIFFGFSFYFLVNVADVLEGFIEGFALINGGEAIPTAAPALAPLANSGLVNLFNFVADILSVLTLIGMAAFLLRRFLGRDKRLSLISYLFGGVPSNILDVGIHVTWWLAIGLILVFFPYFVRSKHIHLMIAPLNLGLAKQTPRGQLDPAEPNGSAGDLEPGARTLHDLSWPRLLDAYSCIMCNRCHDVCPAHTQGLSLSPSALEINKRYLINEEYFSLAGGNLSQRVLTEHVISPEAVWSCTTCYACVRVCPVGNEPMADIIDIRRRMIIAGDEIDSGIQSAMESLAKNGNSFGKGSRARVRWTKDLDFKIQDVTKEIAEILWFVGDTASYDTRVTPLTQKVATILQRAGLDYGILGRLERNSGNDVRRVGEEGLFEQLVEENLEAFGKAQFEQIMTTDPHSLNALRNEYPQYGGMWPVQHYTNILLQLVESGELEIRNKLSHYRATYHDPCYLGRYNGGYAAPRELLQLMGINLTEMPRNRENSFCCGAGGGQIWLGATPDGERPAENRIREALSVLAPSTNGSGPAGKVLFIVACPKDVVMYTDAVKTTGSEERIEVRDIIQLLEEAIGPSEELEVAEPEAVAV
jgi:Fe-S oxidoreductase